jgi:hypothetical protein
MQIAEQTAQDLVELQEDMASYFTDLHFPMSGELYWNMVECVARAKLLEIPVTFEYNEGSIEE